MAKDKQYKLAFRGLNEGDYEFTIAINNEFVERFDITEFTEPDIEVVVNMVKREQLLELKIEGEGFVKVVCDRCLDEYNQDIEFQDTILVKIDAHKSEQIDENLIHVAQQDDYLDLSQYLYESVMLALPLKRVHPGVAGGKNGCNPEMAKHLKPSKPSKKKANVDSRWDALKKMEF